MYGQLFSHPEFVSVRCTVQLLHLFPQQVPQTDSRTDQPKPNCCQLLPGRHFPQTDLQPQHQQG